MGNVSTKKTISTGRLVVAIIFSIILVPVLFALVPAGGVAITASSMVSQDRIEEIVDEARISEEIYDILMDEVANAESGFLKPEVIEDVAKDSIRQKDVDKIVRTIIDGVYNDKSKKIDLSEVEERLQSNLYEIADESFEDLYSAWMYDEPSEFFTEEYKYTFFADLESAILSDYSNFGAADLEALEHKYDSRYGYGAFDDMMSDRIMEERWSYESSIENIIMDSVSKGVEEAEETIKEAIDDVSAERSLRKGIDVARTIGDNRILLNVIVYALIFGLVLVLLLLYKFRTAGFVVASIPLLVGGIGCKVIALLERMIMSLVEDKLISGVVEEEQYQNAISAAMRGVLEVLFGGLSTYGTIMLISGGVLIVIAIVCSIIRKHIGKDKSVRTESLTIPEKAETLAVTEVTEPVEVTEQTETTEFNQ